MRHRKHRRARFEASLRPPDRKAEPLAADLAPVRLQPRWQPRCVAQQQRRPVGHRRTDGLPVQRPRPQRQRLVRRHRRHRPEKMHQQVQHMAAQIAPRARAVGGIGEPDIARHIGLRGAEQRHLERDIGTEDFAEPAGVDHRLHLHHRRHRLHEGIDHRDRPGLPPGVGHRPRVAQVLGERDAVIDMLARAERRHHHIVTQRRAGAAIDDVDVWVGGHLAEIVERPRHAIIRRRLRRGLGPRGTDRGDLDPVETTPSREVRLGAPGGADDADAKGRGHDRRALRRSPSCFSDPRSGPTRARVPSGTARYAPTPRARGYSRRLHG